MKIVFVGPLWDGSTSKMRMLALKDLGNAVIPVDTLPPVVKQKSRGILSRVLYKLGYPPDLARANQQLREVAEAARPDGFWIEKGLTIKPRTLYYLKERFPRSFMLSYSPDDMAVRHNQSRAYVRSIPLYDFHFTTKTYNVEELRTLGANRAIFVGNAYDRHTHRPIRVTELDRKALGGQVGFIGVYESERALAMLELARAGACVRIWGQNWEHWRLDHANLRIERRPVWGEEYSKAICSFDINLCFLRKINRDRQTQRSVEIPACGGFMLAERTQEHLELFVEGREAEFFSSTQELIEKVRFYLNHEERRREIARAGLERCLKSGYDYHSRIRWMLQQVTEA